jgi:hypothetical protein
MSFAFFARFFMSCLIFIGESDINEVSAEEKVAERIIQTHKKITETII